jgi:methylase of polypeptide subunit release factors
LQYVLGNAEFAGLDLAVGPGVFIPRSETEQLVELVEERTRAGAGLGECRDVERAAPVPTDFEARRRDEGAAPAPIELGARRLDERAAPAPTDFGARRLDEGTVPASTELGARPRIIDVGIGSGAILFSLLHRLPQAAGLGIELEPSALEWAERNRRRLSLEKRAHLVRGDLLSGIAENTAEVIVCNPPYIRLDENASLAPEIREHEPPQSLFGGADGMELIRRLIPEAADVLVPGGLLALEIGITQADAVRELLAQGIWSDVQVHPDLTRRPRVVLARRTSG